MSLCFFFITAFYRILLHIGNLFTGTVLFSDAEGTFREIPESCREISSSIFSAFFQLSQKNAHPCTAKNELYCFSVQNICGEETDCCQYRKSNCPFTDFNLLFHFMLPFRCRAYPMQLFTHFSDIFSSEPVFCTAQARYSPFCRNQSTLTPFRNSRISIAQNTATTIA